MRLIPDFEYERCRISIQDPYTINNELIVEVKEERDFSISDPLERFNIRRTVKTLNRRGMEHYYVFDICEFDNKIQSYLHHLDNHRETYVDERGHRFHNIIHTSEQYMQELWRQINRYHLLENYYNYSNNISKDFETLNRQNRLAEYNPEHDVYRYDISRCEINNSRPWCSSNVTATVNRNRSILSADIATCTQDEWAVNQETITNWGTQLLNSVNELGVGVAFGTSPSDIATPNEIRRETTKTYIRPYNYKPEYKHHVLENEHSPLLLGAEIEVGGNTNSGINKEEVVKKCIQIMNGSDDDAEDLIYSTSDSTVQIELDTMPCSLEFHRQMNYKDMFKYLDELGYKGHDCNTAGLHIHADRSYLGDSELKQQLVITKILYILEKFNDEICVIARRNDSYSKFVGDGKNEKSLVELYGKYKDKGKHVALNLKHAESIEFRCFKSTLKYETFLLTLEFVKDIIDYAKHINIEDIELIKWDDLMDTFSDGLKDYYNERLEKEKAKKEKREAEEKNVNSIDAVESVIGTVSDSAIQAQAIPGTSWTLTPNAVYIRDDCSARCYSDMAICSHPYYCY